MQMQNSVGKYTNWTLGTYFSLRSLCTLGLFNGHVLNSFSLGPEYT